MKHTKPEQVNSMQVNEPTKGRDRPDLVPSSPKTPMYIALEVFGLQIFERFARHRAQTHRAQIKSQRYIDSAVEEAGRHVLSHATVIRLYRQIDKAKKLRLKEQKWERRAKDAKFRQNKYHGTENESYAKEADASANHSHVHVGKPASPAS